VNPPSGVQTGASRVFPPKVASVKLRTFSSNLRLTDIQFPG
jgi:hypothetical protein